MPPEMPTTTRNASVIGTTPAVGGRAAAPRPAGHPRLLGERREDELVLVDLVERHRERLVVDRRVDERADVVEERALVQVGVVVVDLTRALGGEDDELVLGVDLRQQLVDGRVDDALVLGHVGSPHDLVRAEGVPGTASNSTTSRAARLTSWFTTFTSNSSCAASSIFAVSRRRACSAADSVPRPVSRRTSSSHVGGSRKTSSASGMAFFTARAPCRSISSSTLRPVARAASIGERGVP